VGDRILEVNGRPYKNLAEFRQAMDRRPGVENRYLFARGGQRFTATVKSVPSGLMRAVSVSGLAYLVGICYVLIGILVFLMRPFHRASRVFLFFATVFGCLIVFLFPLSSIKPSWLNTLHMLFYCLTPSAFLHLALTFPKERDFGRIRIVQMVPYVVSVILFLAIRSSSASLVDAPRALFIGLVVYLTLALVAFLASCIQLWIGSSSEIDKARSKLILLGAGIAASIPMVETVANTAFRTYLVPSFNYYLPFFVVFPAFIGYGIAKHDLFDIDAVIKRTYGYVLTTAGVAGVYGLFVFITNVAFGGTEVARSPVFPLVFVLAVVFLFNPIRNRVQRIIDRVFYRLEYDYQETVQRIGEALRSLLSLDQIGKRIMEFAVRTLFLDAGRLLVLNQGALAYECTAADGGKTKGPASSSELPSGHPLIQKLAARKRELTIYDVQADPAFEAEREACEEAFQRLDATLVVPLIYEEKLTGLIALGRKKSGKFYRREDINLLRTLANQGAVAIQNAVLVREVVEKERMEEELAIARDLQMSMLPAEPPRLEGMEIAARSIPAREVGGDFYDFMEMGDGRLGIVVGDVTGKSVSGALVMSAARGVFRMLSEQELGVSQIMIRANRRLKKDLKSGMFVALLFVVVDAESRTLGLSSGGQTQPIHLHGGTGEARLVQTVGDSFPLGILPDAEYQETRLELAPGDKVVLYTDGIVEAMNERQEMFGFDRLLDVAREGREMGADALLARIMEAVGAFVGPAPQHDDLTAIVLSVFRGSDPAAGSPPGEDGS
jgi:sigma-B regulation protein RsbU (phosphoserine phosphatase)